MLGQPKAPCSHRTCPAHSPRSPVLLFSPPNPMRPSAHHLRREAWLQRRPLQRHVHHVALAAVRLKPQAARQHTGADHPEGRLENTADLVPHTQCTRGWPSVHALRRYRSRPSGCTEDLSTWYQCVSGCPGAVDSHTLLVAPLKKTSNQHATPWMAQGPDEVT